ncbi:hypothetical protein DM02DRAFT_707097 [Neofusicoccum parvum]|nr:hypothetical protein DM02DRAFT_707097 [Neofusicoccum parvum]
MIAIWVTLGMSVASVFVEYICIARVYKMVPALRRTPESTVPAAMEDAIELNAPGTPPPQPKLGIAATAWLRSTANRLLPVKFIPFYFKHQAFLPSISLSLLYLTVLSFSGQMVTFLLASGYNSIHVGIARTVSTIFELSATWIAPRIMRYIGAIRGGMWFLSWQMAWLVGGIAWYFADGEGKGGRQILAVSGLVGGVILSRVGLWGFDLCAQAIIQDAVDLDNRGAFSTVEASFQNLFELLSYVSTIVFSRPNQFQWPAVISAAAVYLAGAMYAGYVRKSRGHLLHYPACIEPRFYERRGI